MRTPATSVGGGNGCSGPERADYSEFSSIAHVDNWVFDLDNTLYSAETELFLQVSDRITEFVAIALKVESGRAERLRREYFHKHGSTLRGMMTNHATDPDHYLDFVHDIDVSAILPNTELDAALGAIRGRKMIFTSANRAHAERILACLGIRDHFEHLFSIESSDYVPKPHRQVYERMIDTCSVDPGRAAMFEDSARNLEPAAALGMVTIWLPNHTDFSQRGGDGDHIDFIVEDLAAWLNAVGQQRRDAIGRG